MHEAMIPVPAGWAERYGAVGPEQADHLRLAARHDPGDFWLEQARRRLDWITPPEEAGDWSFRKEDFHVRWFADGVLNVSVNCLDRHLDSRGDQTAIVFEGDEPGETRRLSYRELYGEVCRMANAMKALGVKRGDRVVLYLPNIPEAAVAMLASARIGAIHSVVFGGFSPDSLASRIQDCAAKLVVTADEGVRGGKPVPLKANLDAALAEGGEVGAVIVVRRTGADVPITAGRDHWWHELRDAQAADCPAEPMEAEDPLFILYTSGSTGKPKGVVHSSGGYLCWIAATFAWTFGARDDDLFWCTADVGWVTGHSYTVYGPLANGATTLMFDGVPTWPDPGRLWETVDRLGVTILYTAPTAIRALMREGDEWVTRYSRSSLRLLGTVGEPINPEAWDWYWRVVGDRRCPVVDTWWQTETGGTMISPFPGATALKPGSATLPLPGVQPLLVDANGQELCGEVEGNLCLASSWPGQMRGVWGEPERYFQTYFTSFPGRYFTGDGARRDHDGYWWITGRVDDVINVAGHRLGSAEIESALVAHDAVAEAAVVARPNDIKGQGIYAFVTLIAGREGDVALADELRQWVRSEIGPIATPEAIQFTPALPKTRSGKILRRILRKIAAGELDRLGDMSTLADPTVVDQLIAERID